MKTTAQFRRAPAYAPTLPPPEQVKAVVGRGKAEIRHTEFARELGLHPRTVRRQFVRGGLPGAKEHSERVLMVPMHLLRLAKVWGLRQVERMAQAGLIPSPGSHSS